MLDADRSHLRSPRRRPSVPRADSLRGCPNSSDHRRRWRRLACKRAQVKTLSLSGKNTLVHLPEAGLATISSLAQAAAVSGARSTVIVRSKWKGRLGALGFRQVMSWRRGHHVEDDERARLALSEDTVAMSVGCRLCPAETSAGAVDEGGVACLAEPQCY